MLSPDGSTVTVTDNWGDCRICGRNQDLRAGVCFDCCSRVKGNYEGLGWHLLWDRENPTNQWREYSEPWPEWTKGTEVTQ